MFSGSNFMFLIYYFYSLFEIFKLFLCDSKIIIFRNYLKLNSKFRNHFSLYLFFKIKNNKIEFISFHFFRKPNNILFKKMYLNQFLVYI